MSGIRTPSSPFSNGTEERAWLSVWCDYCTHDHSMHAEDTGPGCSILLDYMLGISADNRPDGEAWRWPEAWLPEPDDGSFSLPSRMCCSLYLPCKDGDCGGDPAPDQRADRVHTVIEYWKETAR